ncbi:MAG: anti-sigma factor domain-containing protein [Bacillota bacterium]
MGKGILLEVEGRTGVVLTPKGEFKRVPLPRRGAFDVGDEVDYEEKNGLRWGWVAAAAAVLLMLLSPFGYQTYTLAQPAALVLIDINPSIELTVNGKQQVIGARGLNADGEAVLEAITWWKRPVDEVTREITAEAVAEGRLDPGSESSAIVVAVAPVGEREIPEKVASAIVNRSRAAVQSEVQVQAEAKGQEPKTQVAAMEVTKEEVKQAKEQGLTVPRLVILEEVKVSKPEVEVNDDMLKAKGPGQFLKDLNLNPGEIFGEVEKKHNKRDDDAIPANAKGQGQSEKSDGKVNPGKQDEKDEKDEKGEKGEKGEKNEKGEKGAEKSNRPDDKGAPQSKQGDDDAKEKGKGSSEEPRGLLREIKVRLGIGGSDRDTETDRDDTGDRNAEKGRSNSGRGGQEKKNSKENEGSKGNNRP